MGSREGRKGFNSYPKSIAGILLLVLIMTGLVAGSAYADMGWDSWNGPEYLGPGYQFTLEVTSISSPDNRICLTYDVDGDAGSTLACTCEGDDCDSASKLGIWVCEIPTNYNNATIDWDMSGWTAGAGPTCGVLSTPGPSGTFYTSPTAVVLSEAKAGVGWGTAGLLIISGLLGLGLFTGLVVVRSRRRRIAWP
jgi:hypothetical protein